MTQNQMILNHLRQHGSITALEAQQEYGIMRLSARIADLRANGISIASGRQSSKNRWGIRTTYAKYTLIGE
jgi:hypothetical protein